ncbi:hypothetical protein MSHO_31130 [Mycobacterium shottsii]|uniref:Pilin n=1 Tax=Mycobacterium shottsii TaxID=133549 RepID=A0A7I7LDA4_9MYCO|nr:hypothetical protein MSHO_31130 [Mycobacterium shottsii]
MALGLGLAGVGVASEAAAQPGAPTQWCPGDFWDPGWGENWDMGHCHDNWRGPGPNPQPGHAGPGGPGEPAPGQQGPGGPGGRAGGPAGPAGLGDRALGRERRGVRTDP